MTEAVTTPPRISKFQKGRARTVHRSELKPEEYNPRTQDKHARAGLKKQLKGHGLVEPLVWNERTGNLVGGHQRLSILDELEGSLEYSLEVSVIDVDPIAEKQINIALNNLAIMGDWDTDRLEQILRSDGLDLEMTGFDRLEIEALFPDADFSHLFKDEAPAVAADAEEIQRMKQEKKRFKEQGNTQDEANFMRHIVFASNDEAQCFMAFIGVDPGEGDYIDGRRLVQLLGGDWDKLYGDWCQRRQERAEEAAAT